MASALSKNCFRRRKQIENGAVRHLIKSIYVNHTPFHRPAPMTPVVTGTSTFISSMLNPTTKELWSSGNTSVQLAW